MARDLEVTLEVGPRAKMVVAVAPEWPGLERAGKTGVAALEALRSYLPRYEKVARLAGLHSEFASLGPMTVVEEYPGTGSTDFWGISFAFSSLDAKMSDSELRRQIALMRACWRYFDEVRSRVSAEMRKGPRGGGRDRDVIVGHVLATEQRYWAKKLGMRAPEAAVTDAEGITAFRDEYCRLIQKFHSEGRSARTWPLRYLIRHTAYHTMDHSWEMEDKDLTGAE